MSNITSIKPSIDVTLDNVLAELNHWRDTKHEHKQISIPDEIWHKIFSLEAIHSASKLRTLFGVSHSQYTKQRHKLYAQFDSTPTAAHHISDLTNTNEAPRYLFNKPGQIVNGQPVKPEAYKVETRTLVVEFRRNDGRIMTIHTTTDSFSELMESFYRGDSVS